MLSSFEADNYNLRLIRQNVTDEAIAGQPRPDQLLVELVAMSWSHHEPLHSDPIRLCPAASLRAVRAVLL